MRSIVFAVLALGVMIPATAETAPTRSSRQGVWVKSGTSLKQVPFREFRNTFGLTWLKRQVRDRQFTHELPGYSEGPGTFSFSEEANVERVAPQYKLTRQDRRAIQGATAPLYIGKVNKTVGNGLFARRTIPKGTVLGEYTGVLRQDNQQKDRMNGYLFTYDPWSMFGMSVDAEKKGNYMRFANHSSKHANAQSRHVYDQSQRRWHVLLVAKQPIRANDQILFDYSHHYDWKRFGIEQPADLKPRP